MIRIFSEDGFSGKLEFKTIIQNFCLQSSAPIIHLFISVFSIIFQLISLSLSLSLPGIPEPEGER